MKDLPSGTLLFFKSHFDYKRLNDWKHALTKPLHYGIQGLTGSDFHHVGIMCNGWFYEAIGKYGVRKIKLKQKLEEIDNCVEVVAFKPAKEIKGVLLAKLMIDLENQLGKIFSAFQAFLSILSRILIWQTKVKNLVYFCSKLAAYAYKNLYPKILGRIIPRTLNPEEIKKTLLGLNIIKEGRTIKKAYA